MLFFHFRYPRNQNCTWNITAEEGNFIIVDFDEFELEDPQPGGFCAFDHVTFSGGMLNTLLSAIVTKIHFQWQWLMLQAVHETKRFSTTGWNGLWHLSVPQEVYQDKP